MNGTSPARVSDPRNGAVPLTYMSINREINREV